MATAAAILRLSRAKMTVISAVTYLAGATLAPAPEPRRFLAGWAFVLLTQFMTHFLGEVHDRRSDRLNRYATPLTGGSRVLARDLVSVRAALALGYACMAGALAALRAAVPPPARPVGAAIVLGAWAYAAPPAKLNHRALGELDAALVTNVLLPYFAAAVQGAVDGVFPWWSPRLAMLVVPPMFAKVALFLVLNLADRRPDWAAGKRTLPVVLGDRVSACAHFACMCAAYASAVAISVASARTRGVSALVVLAFVLPSAPYGFRISRALLTECPYRMDPLLAPSLFHSTLLVWGIVLHTLVRAAPVEGIFNFQTAFAAVFAFITVRNVLQGRKRAGDVAGAKKSDVLPVSSERAAALCAAEAQSKRPGDDKNFSVGGNVAVEVDESEHETTSLVMPVGHKSRRARSQRQSYDVTVVGGGVAGLVMAASLRQMGFAVVVLERRDSRHEAETGADVALWPGAITILRELGVAPELFDRYCFPLDTIHMCNMDFKAGGEESGTATGVSATVLKTIDMVAVTKGTGEQFVLVPRQELMNALRDVVPDDVVLYGAKVTSVVESEELENVTVMYAVGEGESVDGGMREEREVTSRIVVCADGARSRMRAHVAEQCGHDAAVRFCGEVCYRGVLRFDGGEEADKLHDSVAHLFPDSATDRTMRINYGAGLRSSFGYMSRDGRMAYWWVKECVPQMPSRRGKLTNCPWPEPLKTLHDATPPSAFYMHAIEDSASLSKWSSNRCVLVGDAAHVVTPNMGQGACLATEDAFVLATQLASYWTRPDGHVEAFYRYERFRKPYADAVAAESRKQLFLGQLSSRTAVMLREAMLRSVPESVLCKRFQGINFPVAPHVQTFREAACATQM